VASLSAQFHGIITKIINYVTVPIECDRDKTPLLHDETAPSISSWNFAKLAKLWCYMNFGYETRIEIGLIVALKMMWMVHTQSFIL
jgi:hypothetical protein